MNPAIGFYILSLKNVLIAWIIAIPIIIGIYLGSKRKYAQNRLMSGFAIINTVSVVFAAMAGFNIGRSVWSFILINLSIISCAYILTKIFRSRFNKKNI